MNITAGKYKGQKVLAPDEKITRPTLSKVRMGIFNTLQSLIDFEDSSFLDMYGGSGIMGLEALSRGFSPVVELEKNKKVYNILKNNISKFDDISVVLSDSIVFCQKSRLKYDVIYIDPPYFSGIYEVSLDVAKKICNKIIVLEHVVDLDLTDYNIIKQKKYGNKIISFISVK